LNYEHLAEMQGVFVENIQNVLKFMRIYGIIEYLIEVLVLLKQNNKTKISICCIKL